MDVTEKIDGLCFTHTSTRDQTCNPSMCHNCTSNRYPFTLRKDAQPPEPHWLGQLSFSQITPCAHTGRVPPEAWVTWAHFFGLLSLHVARPRLLCVAGFGLPA